METNTLKRLILNGDMIESPPWLINPGSLNGTEYKNGNLSACFRAGIPGAGAARTLVEFLAQAGQNNWNPEISVRIGSILRKMNRHDTGPNRATVEKHMRIWAGAELSYAGCPAFTPVAECTRDAGTLTVRFNETFLAMSRERSNLYVSVDPRVYTALGSAYALRLYETCRKNLTFRDPDPDGKIRWHIGAECLAKKFAVHVPLKEFVRNIRKAIKEIEDTTARVTPDITCSILFKVVNARAGWSKAVLWFETAKRLDMPAENTRGRQDEPNAERISLSNRLADTIIEACRKTDPQYAEKKIGQWPKSIRQLLAGGRTPDEIRTVWDRAADGNTFLTMVSRNPWRFVHEFDGIFAVMLKPQKAAGTPKQGATGTPGAAPAPPARPKTPVKADPNRSALLDKVEGWRRSGELILDGPDTPGVAPNPPVQKAPEDEKPARTAEQERKEKLDALLDHIRKQWPDEDCGNTTYETELAVAEWAIQNNSALPDDPAELKALAERLTGTAG